MSLKCQTLMNISFFLKEQQQRREEKNLHSVNTHAMWEMSITRNTLVCFIRATATAAVYSIYSEMRRRRLRRPIYA